MKWHDPSGLGAFDHFAIDLSGPSNDIGQVERVIVTGTGTDPNQGSPDFDPTRFGLSPFGFDSPGFSPGGEPGEPEQKDKNTGLDKGPHDKKTPAPNTPPNNPPPPATNPSNPGNVTNPPSTNLPSPTPSPNPNQWVQQQGITLMVGGGIIVVGGVGLIVLSPVTAPVGVTITLAGAATVGLGGALWVGGFVLEHQEGGH